MRTVTVQTAPTWPNGMSPTGLDTTGAAAALAAAGLKLGTVIESYSTTIPAGVLISQKPVPGANTPKGSTIDLIVSKGPESVVVPNVIKKTEADARKVILAAGFKVVVSRKADKATKGTVVTQKPASGKAQPGITVTLTVSEGILSPRARLLGTWKSSDGSTTYMFRPANRVKVPSGGVVRYRISGSTLQIYYPVGPLLGTITWDSFDQFALTVGTKVTTYNRVK